MTSGPAGRAGTASAGTAGLTYPSWLAPTGTVLCALGIAVSSYLTFEHYTAGSTLACPEGDVVNCAKVTSSSFSVFLGVPVALLGLLFFVAMLVLCLPAVVRRPERWLATARLGVASIGVIMVLYLLWAELFSIHAICLWCTAVHVLTFLLFVTVLFGQLLATPADSSD